MGVHLLYSIADSSKPHFVAVELTRLPTNHIDYYLVIDRSALVLHIRKSVEAKGLIVDQ